MTFLWFIIAWVLCGQVIYQIMRRGETQTVGEALKMRTAFAFIWPVILIGVFVIEVKDREAPWWL